MAYSDETSTGPSTKLASIILHGSFHSATLAVPVPILWHDIGLGPPSRNFTLFGPSFLTGIIMEETPH